jgi:hypothetical protein
MSDGRLLICDIAATTTTFIFSSTMLSLKRPAASINRPVAKQGKYGVCGHLSHNHRKCTAVPAAAATPVVEGQVGSPNDVTDVTKVAPPLLLSNQLLIKISTLIGEVSVMFFLIWKQQEGVGRGTKLLSWRQPFWTKAVSKLRMLLFLNM